MLGGGGAKGAAHIGVLRALEEMQIPVDYIAGTSMGAYIGGLYATGMSADEIEAFLTTVDWQDGYKDRVERSERRIRDKQKEDRFQINTDVGFELWQIKVPKGFVQGQNMARILRETSGGIAAQSSFDNLPIPYRAMATDIENLTSVELKSGDLVQAMQASMSIPAILPPMELDGKLLVDGGITNNLPVSVVKAMGADIVIAVDLSNEFKKRDELQTYFAVMDQLTDFMIHKNTTQQIGLLSDADILIQPDVKGISTTDMGKMGEASDIGYRSTLSYQSQLAKLGNAVDFQQYVDKKTRQRRKLERVDELYIDEIQLVNHSNFSDRVLLNHLNLKKGEDLDTEKLEQGVRNLYALDRFERVDYQIVKQDDKNVVQVDVQEKSWGPNYLDLRFALEDDFTNNTRYSLGMALNVTGLSEAGAEWRTELEFGSDKRASTELYLPFIDEQELFGLIGVEYRLDNRNALLFTNTELPDENTVDPSRFETYTFDASVGWQPTLWQALNLGYRYIYGTSELKTLPSNIGDSKRRSQEGYARYSYDTLDNIDLPTQGNFLVAEFAISSDKQEVNIGSLLQGEEIATSFDLVWTGAYTLGRHTFMGKAEYGRINSESPFPLEPKELGGFLNLSGAPKGVIAAKNKIFSAAIYRYRIMDNDFGLFQSPVYVGGSLEWGGVYNNSHFELSEIPTYYAGSIFSGISTPIGPLIFAYGRTEQNYSSFYVQFGSKF
ncbi:patatin-like phospholipase family protein [Photobacterium jeanii]|uniref:patatin-like phospholipase family protein n=1 Tax=Photobacterium jeanii TaxID=858640 RepID=UPI001E32ECA3|nr:patatin-like phospholipase family protein [Photobacterium jeanii]